MTQRSARLIWLAGVLALIFISMVLRPAVAAVGPLLSDISSSLPLSATETSLLASAPVFCFGVGAFLGPALVRKLGLHHAMFFVLIALLVSTVGRLFGGAVVLLVGTVVVGLAIAVVNVLLPTVVRTDYPNRIPLITGIYATLLAVFASFAAATAVPWAQSLGGWRNSLLIWSIPVLIAVVLWATQLHRAEKPVEATIDSAGAHANERRAVNRSPITWLLVGFFGLQSLGFYAILGWLPNALIAAGAEPISAGAVLGITTAIGIPFGLLLSSVMGRFKSLAMWSAIASLLPAVGFTLMAITLATKPADLIAQATIAGALIGLGQASTFQLSLSLIGSRASTKSQTTMLSALSQGWGYLLAGVGTLLVGLVADASGSFAIPFAALAALTFVQVIVGYLSGRPGQIPAR
ncbi:MAG: MFS transporter [Actinomycetales bacterium]|nr:MFS transporter [Actinomycetales bacterium]